MAVPVRHEADAGRNWPVNFFYKGSDISALVPPKLDRILFQNKPQYGF